MKIPKKKSPNPYFGQAEVRWAQAAANLNLAVADPVAQGAALPDWVINAAVGNARF